jgi:hypothetical protein
LLYLKVLVHSALLWAHPRHPATTCNADWQAVL